MATLVAVVLMVGGTVHNHRLHTLHKYISKLTGLKHFEIWCMIAMTPTMMVAVDYTQSRHQPPPSTRMIIVGRCEKTGIGKCVQMNGQSMSNGLCNHCSVQFIRVICRLLPILTMLIVEPHVRILVNAKTSGRCIPVGSPTCTHKFTIIVRSLERSDPDLMRTLIRIDNHVLQI